MAESLNIQVALEGGEETRTELSLLEKNLYSVGAALGDLARATAKFAEIGAPAAIILSAAALVKFTNAVEATEQALTQLQKVSGASFQNLSGLQQVFAAGGTALNKFATEFGNLSEKIKDADITKAFRDPGTKVLADWANKIDDVTRKFDNLAQGTAQTFDQFTSGKTQVEALLESLAKVKDPQEQWNKLADIFHTLAQQGTQGIAVMARLGQALGLSPQTITTLSQGSAALREMQAEAERLGLTLTTSNQQALQQMAQGWNQFTALLSAAFQKIAAAAAPVFAQLIGLAKTALAQIVSDFQTLPLDQAMANLGARIEPAFNAAMAVLQPVFARLGEQLVTAAEEIGLAMGKALILGMLPGIVQGKGPIVDAIKSLLQTGTASLGDTGGEQPGGAAAGGLIGGYGTGTSDSNLAWVSRGEHIMPAHAVAQPGVLTFLEALRRSGGSLTAALNGMRHFALGGLVMRPTLAYAGGGLVGGMSNVTIAFPGLPAIGGLRASVEVVGELQRAAALAQVRSGGRKPSRYS